MSTPIPEPEFSAFEAALAALAPSPGRLDRDVLMFRAGQAAVARPVRTWAWPATTAALALISLRLAVALAVRHDTNRNDDRVVQTVKPPAVSRPIERSPSAPQRLEHPVASAPPQPQSEPRDADLRGADAALTAISEFARQRRALQWGLDVLPELPPAGPPAPMEALDRALGLPPGSLDGPSLHHRGI